MKKIIFAAAVTAVAVMLLLSACSGEKIDVRAVSVADVSASDTAGAVSGTDVVLTEEEQEIVNVIVSNTDAFNAEDQAAYMAAIDPECEGYEQTKAIVKRLFKRYELTASIDSVEVVSVSGDTASVHVTQTTVRNDNDGWEFADVQTVMLYSMTRRDGIWYISSTVVESRREIDSTWDPLAELVAGTVTPTDAEADAEAGAEISDE